MTARPATITGHRAAPGREAAPGTATAGAPPATHPAPSPAASSDTASDPLQGRGGDEVAQLTALRASGALLNRPQAALDAIARAAAALCGAPTALVNFLDETTLVTGAAAGFDHLGFPRATPRATSVCQHTIAAPDRLTVIPDLAEDPRAGCDVAADAGLRFYAGANILSGTDVSLGVVCVLDTSPRELSDVQRAGLRDLAAVAAALIEQHGLAQRLVAVTDRLGREAGSDPLTGLHNRRALEPVLANLPPRTALAMVDLDCFKALNDRAGHDAGDDALRGYADLFRGGIRGGDVAARWGGEEFLLVLADSRDPRLVLDRLRAGGARAGLPVTFSAGLTAAVPGEDPRRLVARADTLLYRAKDAGRDRIVDDLT